MKLSIATAGLFAASSVNGMKLTNSLVEQEVNKDHHYSVLAKIDTFHSEISLASRVGLVPFDRVDFNPTTEIGYHHKDQVYFDIVDNKNFQSVAEKGSIHEGLCLNKCLVADKESAVCAQQGYEEVSNCGMPRENTTQDFELNLLNHFVSAVPVITEGQKEDTYYAMRPFEISFMGTENCLQRDREQNMLTVAECGRSKHFLPSQYFFFSPDNKIYSPSKDGKSNVLGIGMSSSTKLEFTFDVSGIAWEYEVLSGHISNPETNPRKCLTNTETDGFIVTQCRKENLNQKFDLDFVTFRDREEDN